MPDVPTIDLDAEAILFDGHWYTRDDLARRIKAMLDSGDFNLSRPSQALEQLTQVMASVRTVAFRATPDIVEALNRSAAQQGKTVGNRIRELLVAGLGTGGHGVVGAEPVAAASPAPPPPTIKPVPHGGGGGGGVGGGGGQVAAPAVPMAGPGALRSAGVDQQPSVVVEPALQEEGAIELTERKKGDETPSAESRWFKS
jgi:hypothetical protein